jgi:phosphate starvation-inducible PhoH-like protein
MGTGSKIVAAGDTTQVDLPRNTRSGLIDALTRLRQIKGVCEVKMTKADIVRHRLVQEIVSAYEADPGSSGVRRARR